MREQCAADRLQQLKAEIFAMVSAVVGDAGFALTMDSSFLHSGVTSAQMGAMSKALSGKLGRPLPIAIVFDYPTIACIVHAVVPTFGSGK